MKLRYVLIGLLFITCGMFSAQGMEKIGDAHRSLLKAASKGDVLSMKDILHGNSGTLLLNAVDEDGQGLLHAAVISGNLEACKFLLQFKKVLEQHGVGINSKDLSGNTPLHCAVSSFNRGCEEMVFLLLCNGADTLIQNSEGNTALHLAVAYSEYKSIAHILTQCKQLEKLLSCTNKVHRTVEQFARRNTDKVTILALIAKFKSEVVSK